MSNYVKSTDFAAKDALASGNAGKIVKGTEIDTEFNNIAVAVATKADLTSPAFTGNPTAPTPSSGDNDTSIATTAFVQTVLATAVAAAKEAIFPVGSIYTNADDSTNPGTLLGFGTWTAFGAGRMLVGLNAADSSFDTAGETGGSKDAIVVSHTHTITDPGHSHNPPTGYQYVTAPFSGDGSIDSSTVTGSSERNGAFVASATNTTGISLGTTGSSGANANLPPYIVVYMWKRTA